MERNLTGQIIDIFKSKLGWTVYYFDTDNDVNQNNFDGHLQVNTGQGAIHLKCEIKKSVVPSSIAAIKQAIEKTSLNELQAQGSILLANYISTKARELLIDNNINYADTGGNIYIKYKDIHIQIETGQSDRSSITNNGGRAFTKTGLKVLYQFFRSEEQRDLNGNLIYEVGKEDKSFRKAPYQDFADLARVSKDTVSKVIFDLLKQGFILKKNNKEFKWRDKKRAFERWSLRVNEVLRPSLMQRRFTAIGDPRNKVIQLPSGDYQLGGYYGAEKWVSDKPWRKLDSEKKMINAPLLIYTHKGFNQVVQDLDLISDPQGNVTVIEAFWENKNISPSADFPVLYADLIDSNDSRMLNVAQQIYLNYFHDKL